MVFFIKFLALQFVALTNNLKVELVVKMSLALLNTPENLRLNVV